MCRIRDGVQLELTCIKRDRQICPIQDRREVAGKLAVRCCIDGLEGQYRDFISLIFTNDTPACDDPVLIGLDTP